MQVTPEAIRDYEACPRYYDFNYDDKGVGIDKMNKRQKLSFEYMEAIKRVANYYLFKKQGFSDPTLKSLYNRWQKDWFQNETVVDIMKMPNSIQQNSKTAFSTRASEIIKLFFRDFETVTGDQIFWLNEEYIVPILGKQATLKGKVDFVLRQKEKNTFHIFQWADSTKTSEHWRYNMTAAEYAFRYRYDFREMKTRHYLWNFYGTKPGRQEVSIETKDFKSMGYYADQMLNDDIMAPRYGYSTYCKSCPFERKCVKWQFPESENRIEQ